MRVPASNISSPARKIFELADGSMEASCWKIRAGFLRATLIRGRFRDTVENRAIAVSELGLELFRASEINPARFGLTR